MSIEENKKLILEHYESFMEKQDADAVRKQLSPDFRDHEMPPETPPGPESAIQLRAMLHRAFPDLRVRIEDVLAEGDRIAIRATWTGTHRGALPIMPVPPMNRPFTFTGMVFWRVRDGKIVERWATIDRLGLQQQLTGESKPE
ncbi:MAG TPA: ester cyclase [Candidatus Acidoferrales bacterium]|nr:ester cyclase [Candidatus Acidoferrales bacterium]